MRTKGHQHRDKEQNEEHKVRKRVLFSQHITYYPLSWTEHRNTLLSISLTTQRREAGETGAVFWVKSCFQETTTLLWKQQILSFRMCLKIIKMVAVT